MAPSMVRVPIENLVEGDVARREGGLTVEKPLEIRAGRKSLSVTMHTSGRNFELAAGRLFSDGIVSNPGHIASFTHLPDGNPNIAPVTLARDAIIKPLAVQRAFVMTSGCGLCGKAPLAALEANRCPTLPPQTITFDSRILYAAYTASGSGLTLVGFPRDSPFNVDSKSGRLR
jgi:FdhD protein